jgi:hypothetical protein
MKCIVDKCSNNSMQGNGRIILISAPFAGDTRKRLPGGFHPQWICHPCFQAIVSPTPGHEFTQVYQNMIGIQEREEKVDES